MQKLITPNVGWFGLSHRNSSENVLLGTCCRYCTVGILKITVNIGRIKRSPNCITKNKINL